MEEKGEKREREKNGVNSLVVKDRGLAKKKQNPGPETTSALDNKYSFPSLNPLT
jgi:hypothetical protein